MPEPALPDFHRLLVQGCLLTEVSVDEALVFCLLGYHPLFVNEALLVATVTQ